MIRVVVILSYSDKRYTIIKADSGEIVKRSGIHRTKSNCIKQMELFIEKIKATHLAVRLVHV